MPSFQQFISEIIEKKQLNAKVVRVKLKLISPPEINFEAGQFVTIKIDEKTPRSYSIFSPPSEKNSIELIVDITPGGQGSKFFINAQVGQQINFIGPLGKFVFAPTKNKICFIVTGTGYAPIHSMIADLFRRGGSRAALSPRVARSWGGSRPSPTEIHLLYGDSYLEEIVGLEELKDWQKKFSNFKCTLCISREEKEGCFHGRITDYLSGAPLQNTHFFICGGRNVVSAVISLLSSTGVPAEQISTEQF